MPKAKSTRPGSAKKAVRTRSKPAARASAAADTKDLSKESKQGTLLAMLRTPTGASIEELAKALSWQPHSVRGFLSGTVKKKLKLEVHKHRAEGEATRYSLGG